MENKPFSIFSIGDDSLANEICNHSTFSEGLGNIRLETFSDGEMSTQYLESIRDNVVFLVCSTTSSDKILMLQLAIDAARRASASEIVVLAPYFGYARQDRKEGIRGPIGAKVICNMITKAGAGRLITSDLHSDQIAGFLDIPVDHIFGKTIFRNYLQSLPPADNYSMFSPDTGGVKRAEKMYELMYKLHPETTFGLLHKKRDKPNSIEKMILIGDVKGRKVKLVDDMCDTAGTLVKAAEIVMDAGAESCEAICTHPLLTGPALERIDKCDALSSLVVSDSIYHGSLPSKVQVISGAPVFARVIDTIVTRQSVDKINQ